MRGKLINLGLVLAAGVTLCAGIARADFRALYGYGMVSSPGGLVVGLPGTSESAANGMFLAGQFTAKPIGPVAYGLEIGLMPRLYEYEFEYRDPACPSQGKEKRALFPVSLIVEARLSGIFFQGRLGTSLIKRKGGLVMPNPLDPVNQTFDEVYSRPALGGSVGYRVAIPKTTLAVDFFVRLMIISSFTYTEFGVDSAGVLHRTDTAESLVIMVPGFALTGTNPAGPKPTL